MADWTQDPTNPDLVMSPDGRIVPRDTLGPMDRVVAAPTAAPAPASPAVPAVPGAPAPPLNAASVLGKLDAVTAPLNQRSAQLPIAQTTTTTQSAIPQSVLDPIKQRNTERATMQSESAIQRGEATAQRGEQQAMNTTATAYGGYVQSEADAQRHAQNAEIARQSELAFAAQKDPSIDPDRFVRSMSTGQSIGTVILAALNGAFRGMSGQGGEGVVDILNRRIDQDIAAQKEQIQSGRIRRGNLISYFRTQGMNELSAENAARAMSWVQLGKMTDSENARLAAGAAREDGKALGEAIKMKAEQANDELQLTLGTPRSTTSVVRQAPGGGGDGDSFTKMLAARKAYEESGATPEQLAVFDKTNGLTGAGMAPGGESEVARARREKSEARTDTEKTALGALTLLDQLGTELGLAKDPNGKGFREDPNDKDLLSKRTGEELATGFSFGLADNPIEATEKTLIESFGRLQSQGVISPSEEIRFAGFIRDAKTQSQRAIALNAIRPIIEAKLNQRDKPSGGVESAGFRRVTP